MYYFDTNIVNIDLESFYNATSNHCQKVNLGKSKRMLLQNQTSGTTHLG